MSIRVQLADGRILEFPDGTDPSVIQSTVKRLIGEGVTQDNSNKANTTQLGASNFDSADVQKIGSKGLDVFSLVMVVLIGVIFSFFLERKISKLLQTKVQKVLLAIACTLFGIGLIGVLNELIVMPLSGLPTRGQALFKYGFFNILVFPLLIGVIIWILKKKDIHFPRKNQPSEDLYAQAMNEVDVGGRVDGLWAKCFAEASGDERVAKAQYIKIRVQQLQQESNSPSI
jgi:hypothetical protein